MKMRAVDTLHISSVGPDLIRPGDEFEVSDSDAKDLENRGLAKRVGGAKAEASVSNKDEGAAPANKAEAAPMSRATVAPKAKRGGKR